MKKKTLQNSFACVLLIACAAKTPAPESASMRTIDARIVHTPEPLKKTEPAKAAVAEPKPAPKPEPPKSEPKPEPNKPVAQKPKNPPKPIEPPPPDPILGRRERALGSLRRPFVAEQNVAMQSEGSEQRSRATFYVFPGAGYRMHIKGPLDVTLLDVAVRCGHYRYAVPLKLRRFEGPLSEAAQTVGHFPVEALYALFDPHVRGKWTKDTFVADHGTLIAVLHPTLDAFAYWRINDAYGRPIEIRIESFAQDEEGYLLPKRWVMALPDGRKVVLDAEAFHKNLPPISQAISQIAC